VTHWLLLRFDGFRQRQKHSGSLLIDQGAMMGKLLTAGGICKRKVSVGYRQTSLVAAAQLMREDHVGCLVVVDDANGSRKCVG
jgi:predicted transcriptional regulator